MPDLSNLFGEIIDVLHSRGLIDVTKRDDLKTLTGEVTGTPADATSPEDAAVPEDATVTGTAFREPVFDEPAKP